MFTLNFCREEPKDHNISHEGKYLKIDYIKTNFYLLWFAKNLILRNMQNNSKTEYLTSYC